VSQPIERARAKVNLTLHVGETIRDPSHRFNGYHPLESLVVFSDIADELSCDESLSTGLTINGPFGTVLEPDNRNLILKAYERVSDYGVLPNLQFSLIKNLPIASGIGGGSADAAAALRLLRHFIDLKKDVWTEIALSLGADIPVCLGSKTAIMSGIGQDIRNLSGLGQIPALLINPGKMLSTADVFQQYDGEASKMGLAHSSAGSLMEWARLGRNDLQKSAIALCPDILEVLERLQGSNGCQIARMSGSGATCFGLFNTTESAKSAQTMIKADYPDWWVKFTTLGDP